MDTTSQSPSHRFERSYSVAEIERLTGVNRRSVYRAVASGRLSAIYPNGSKRGMRVWESELARWLKEISGTPSLASCSSSS